MVADGGRRSPTRLCGGVGELQPSRAGHGSVAASASPRGWRVMWTPLSRRGADWVRTAQARARGPARTIGRRGPRAAAKGRGAGLYAGAVPGILSAVCGDLPGRAMPKIAVRDMNTRWGSCSLRTGTLAFARRLCTMPLPAQEYVVVHEFCHFAHPDHSPAFWAAVAEVLPDYKQRERMLKLR